MQTNATPTPLSGSEASQAGESRQLAASSGPQPDRLRGLLFRNVATCLAIASIAWLDYVTGTEISLAIFYLAPVAWLGWHYGHWAALPWAIVAACAWYAAEILGGKVYSHPAIPIWNAVVRLGFFAVSVEALHRARDAVRAAEALARTDGLTGLYNARAFRESVGREVARCHRYGAPLAIAYMDVDNFKGVNDSLGHATGDRVLAEVAKTLKSRLRSVDMIARLGGDEFAVLLPETDSINAGKALEKVRADLERMVSEHDWPVSFSIGIASFETPPANVDELIRRADHLMYEVKRSGKRGIRQRQF